MFEKIAEENGFGIGCTVNPTVAWQKGAEVTLRKVIKYFSILNLDENCGGYFSHLLENEEGLQELAKELEGV